VVTGAGSGFGLASFLRAAGFRLTELVADVREEDALVSAAHDRNVAVGTVRADLAGQRERQWEVARAGV
jgi:hypothetical protein